MSAPLWLPGVTRLPPTGQGTIPLGLQGRGRRLFTWHTFEAPYSYSPDGRAAMRYLHSQGSTSHFVFHPTTGALIQALPANVGARTLRAAPPGQHTNAYGDVHMQVEVIAYARRPWTLDLTPAGRASLQRLMDFLRSWGIPDQWAWTDMVRPPATYAEANRPGSRGQPDRSGHATHSRWWANDHWDPGAIERPWVIAPAPRPTPPKPDPDVARAQTILNDTIGASLDVDGYWGPLTEQVARTYAAEYGYTGRVTDLAALLTHLEDTMSRLDAIEAKLDNLLNQPFPASPLSRQEFGDGPHTLGSVLDHTWRRAQQTWRYAHSAGNLAGQARDTARATADRMAGLEAAVTELATHVQGVDPDLIERVVRDAVGRYELSIERIDTETDTEPEED